MISSTTIVTRIQSSKFMVGVVMYFCENRSTIMVISFFLFWRHGCSAARNSSACKGKSLRCLRKCRFSYIDTSPALPARRHLTAALSYSACPPHPPSCLHLGSQTHQTWCAPGHLGAAPCSAHPIQNFLPGTKVAIVRVIWRMARPRAALEPDVRLCVAVAQVVKVKAGCVAIWQRLRAIGRPACHHR